MASVGHRLPLISLYFVSGIAAVQLLSDLPGPAGLVFVLAVAAVVLRWPRTWPLAAVSLGVVWAVLRALWILSDALPSELIGKDLTIVGEVVSIPARTKHYQEFLFAVEEMRDDLTIRASPGKIRLRWYADEQVRVSAGEQWQFRVRLKPPRGLQNPGGFDFEGWLFRQRIRATGYIRTDPRNTRVGPAAVFGVTRWRQHISDAILAHTPGKYAGLLTALAVGARHGVSQEQWRVLRRTGTAHLMAISGLHIGLVAWFGMLMGSTLWRSSVRGLLWRPAREPGAALGLLTALSYAALAGFSIPTQRALVMASVLMLGVLVRRQAGPLQLLALALLGVLVWDPLAVLDPGCWLSFFAVAAIYWAVTRRVGVDGMSWLHRWRRWMLAQWLLWLALAPLLLLFFQQVSFTAPLANFIAVPVVGLVVVPLVLAGVLSLAFGWGDLAITLWHWAAQVLDGLWPMLVWLSDIELGTWQGGSPPWWVLAIALCGAVVLALPRGIPGRWIGVILFGAPFLWSSPAPAPGDFAATVLDVGQGLSVIIRTHAHTLVYDTGARYRSGFNIGDAVVVPFLRRHAFERVDALVISHGDNDHIGGVHSLLEQIEVGRRLSSVPERIPGASPCVRGQSWRWDGVLFEVLHPQETRPAPHNNASCVLKVSGSSGAMLLTGDIEAAAERQLLDQPGQLRSDVLLVPHQGSRTSSTPAFIAAVAPRIAVVSTGYSNHYGHPHPQVVARYRRAEIPFYDTARAGAVTVHFADGRIAVEQQRWRAHRYWFSP